MAKLGKAAGVYEVCPGLLRADLDVTASRLTSCYSMLWETERWPKVWKKGLVVKVFKKGDLRVQANEWRAGLYVLFVDFEKAFDSVYRESLWNIMRSYGIPDKIVSEIASIYEGFECAVADGSVTSDWCMIKSGVNRAA
ncbi:uncharacterized protein [Montipora foliosa]|uniref:uncharacterized protein n=1 Tax=Montipora foliosa TaxID=591990 RepID=UPI0035F21557